MATHTTQQNNCEYAFETICCTFFTDDQICILAYSEDKLQCSVYNLQNTVNESNTDIAAMKPKILAFQGKHFVCNKICIYNKVIEQPNYFKYLGS
jgi:hypothetical protein